MISSKLSTIIDQSNDGTLLASENEEAGVSKLSRIEHVLILLLVTENAGWTWTGYLTGTGCKHCGGIKANINETCYLKERAILLGEKLQQVTKNIVSDLCTALLSQSLVFLTQNTLTINSILLLAIASLIL